MASNWNFAPVSCSSAKNLQEWNLLVLLLCTSQIEKVWSLSGDLGAFAGLMQGWGAGGLAMELLAAFVRGLPEGAGTGAPLRGLLDSNLLPRDCHELLV